MKKIPHLVSCTVTGAFCAALMCPNGAYAGHPGYRMYDIIKLGGEGGWDNLNLDPASSNLFITRGTHVMVFDPISKKVVADIAGLNGVHATAFADGRAFITEGGSNKLAVVDTSRFTVLSEIPVGKRPEDILYDPFSRRVFTFNVDSNDTTVVDVLSGKAIGTVALGGKPRTAVSDGTGMIFVNIEDKNELVAFDTVSLSIKARYSLGPCESPSGIAADVAHGRIFSGCKNKMVAVTDARTGKIVTTFSVGEGTSTNRFDPSTGLVFSANGKSGTLTVAIEDSPNNYMVMQNVLTDHGAGAMELDPKTHIAYLIAADLKPGISTVDNPNPQPVTVPGTFRLLIVRR